MQQLNPSEISDIIKQRIEKLDVASEARNQGTIVGVSDGIVKIHGLEDAMFGEMIEFPGGIYGMVLNLERDSVGAVVLGDYLLPKISALLHFIELSFARSMRHRVALTLSGGSVGGASSVAAR